MADAKTSQPPGRIVSIYSYRRGTGRSTLAASLGCMLAKQTSGGRGTLVIDMEVSTPSLHYLFSDYAGKSRSPHSRASAMDTEPGTIELLLEVQRLVSGLRKHFLEPPQSKEDAARLLAPINLTAYIVPTTIAGLSVMKAGCFNSEFQHKVGRYRIDDIYEKSPHALEVIADRLRQMYDYIVIDCSSGLDKFASTALSAFTDTLVHLMTLNNQNLKEASDIILSVLHANPHAVILPVPARVDLMARDRYLASRHGRTEVEGGFEGQFLAFFRRLYSLGEDASLSHYFDQICLPHSPPYSFGEEIPPLVETGSQQKSDLLTAYERLLAVIVSAKHTWQTT